MNARTFTEADKLACVERELRMRKQVYPRWVAAGRMKQEKADLRWRRSCATTRRFAKARG